jgi:hypothetical protein
MSSGGLSRSRNLHDPSNLIDLFLATVASVPIVCLVFFVRWQRSFVPQSREVYGFDASIQKLRSHVTRSQMSVPFSRSAGNSRLVMQFPSWRDCGVTYLWSGSLQLFGFESSDPLKTSCTFDSPIAAVCHAFQASL